MRMPVYRWLLGLGAALCCLQAHAHPLRLSLTEIEYSTVEQRLSISLRLFLTDVNEALVFDPDSRELKFTEPDEAMNAESLLLDYLGQHFSVSVDGYALPLIIQDKRLSGEGQNTALAISLEDQQTARPRSIEIRNSLFTDLFYDQTNIIYVHIDDDTESLMLNKTTPLHSLSF